MTTLTPPPEGGPQGWMAGAPRLTCQRCGRCGAVWYFHRSLCPSCGTGDPATVAAAGRGIVAAVTVVRRAPTPELRGLAPYRVVLVDMAEGFRMMAHAPMAAANGAAVGIGTPVLITFHDFGGRPMPLAVPAQP